MTSSIVTADSGTQFCVEGQWDETVPLIDIHEGIVTHLTQKLERLKTTYRALKARGSDTRRADVVLKKIIRARIEYQKFIASTRDILTNCSMFIQSRRDTPESRVAFIRNAQEYFNHARDFVNMEVTLRKISPSLTNSLKPLPTDDTELASKKRRIHNALTEVLNNSASGSIPGLVGKGFRSRFARQSKILEREFIDRWITFLPRVLQRIVSRGPREQRWPRTVLYTFTNHCDVRYVHHGFCTGCYFPIINDGESAGLSAGKLYCHSCCKEIEWTYFMNPRTIHFLFSQFSTEEIEQMKQAVSDAICEDISDEDDARDEGGYRSVLHRYIGRAPHQDPSICDPPTSSTPPTFSPDHRVQPATPHRVRRSYSRKPPQKMEQDNVKNSDVSPTVDTVAERLAALFGNDHTPLLSSKPFCYSIAKDLQNFEAVSPPILERGLIPRIERYILHYFGVPSKEEVRARPLNERGAREGTNRKMIISALVGLNANSMIPHVSFIAHKLWHYAIPDLSEHRSKIIDDCTLFREVAMRLEGSGGNKWRVNQNICLVFVLNKHGYPWTLDDFRIHMRTPLQKRQWETVCEVFEIIEGSRPLPPLDECPARDRRDPRHPSSSSQEGVEDSDTDPEGECP